MDVYWNEFVSRPVYVVAAVAALSLAWYLLTRPRWNLPPGPRPLPLIGNVFQVSMGKEWLQYAQWGKEYGAHHILQEDSDQADHIAGPIVYLNFLGERVFVLNSQQAATDILEKHMNTYAGRPQNMVMASELYVLPLPPAASRHVMPTPPTASAGTAPSRSTPAARSTPSSVGS